MYVGLFMYQRLWRLLLDNGDQHLLIYAKSSEFQQLLRNYLKNIQHLQCHFLTETSMLGP
jgi:hypothetical protein